MTSTSNWLRRSVALALACTCLGAAAQVTLPEGPVHIIIPTTPGTTPDIMARAMAPRLGERLGRPVVVENRVGAGGVIGTDFVAHGVPNGSTLLLSASSLSVGASLFPALPYDPVKDLTPIALIGWNRLVLVAPSSTGFRTVADLIAAARKSPGKLTYASPGLGTPNHLAAELFKVKTGTFLTHIPYKGSGPQTTAVLAGEVDMAPLTVNVAAPQIKAGRLVALAITGSKRSGLLPDVPALSEVRVPGVEGDIWYGLLGPKGMSPELVAMLNREVNALLRSEEISSSFKAKGFDQDLGTPDDFRKLITTDVARWAALIKAQGIKPE